MSSSGAGIILSESSNVINQIYRMLLSISRGTLVFHIVMSNKSGTLARLLGRLARLNLNLLMAYAYTLNSDSAAALLIYEASDGKLEEAVKALEDEGALVKEAYEVKVVKAIR